MIMMGYIITHFFRLIECITFKVKTKVDFVTCQCRVILGKKKKVPFCYSGERADHGPGCGGCVVRGCDVWELSIWEFSLLLSVSL